MLWMENHLDRAESTPEPQPAPRPKLRARDLVLGTIVAALFAACVVVAAILSFDVNPAGPVVVVVAAITAGSLAVRRVADVAQDSTSGFPTIASLGGLALFTLGSKTSPVSLPPSPTPLNQALRFQRAGDSAEGSAYRKLLSLGLDSSSPILVREVADAGSRLIANSLALTDDPSLATAFPGTPLGGQLKQAAKLMALRVVLADALQDEEGRRAVAVVGDQMRAARAHGIRLSGLEADVLLGVAQEDAQSPLEDVEGVLHAAVVVPRDLLGGPDLEFRDAEARPLGVTRTPLDLVQLARVLDRLHGRSSLRSFYAGAGAL